MNIVPVKHFTDYMEESRFTQSHPTNCKALILMDGTELSIQASNFHYCSPRQDLPYNQYTEFEIGFPSRVIPEIMEWVEDSSDPTGTVYACVPKSVIEDFIAKAGGVKDVVTRGEIVD